MFARLTDWIIHAWYVLERSNGFMLWNTFLAIIPLVLSVWLFRKSRSRNLIWWFIFLVFIAFLPNAPYVLTDIIHLIEFIQHGFSVWTITLVLIPQYFLFILIGFQAYVLSLINLGYYLKKLQLRKYVIPLEIVAHLLCALGIYLGRFQRFNSWDILTNINPLVEGVIANLTDKWSIFTIAVTFVILTALYWFMKQVTLGIAFRFRYAKQIQE